MMTREELKKTLAIEQEILQEVYSQTRLRFGKLGGIDTQNARTAQAVLPVLREWAVRKITEMPANIRHAIYAVFSTPHASEHVNILVEWWQKEDDRLARNCLSYALAKCATPDYGERLWELTSMIPIRDASYPLLAKLATFPNVSRRVRDRLVEVLESGAFVAGELYEIATVNDPRIRKWFVGQLDSPNPDIRAVAKRVAKRGERLPRGVAYASSPPDRRTELFSTEIDLAEAEVTLGQVAGEFALKIPAATRKARFLDYADLDRWIIAPVTTKNGGGACVWFRLEDVDAVEMVVTGKAPGEPEKPM